MATGMPPAETEISVELVRSLLEDQRRDLARLEIVPFASGWDNSSFRLGQRLIVRLPRRGLAAGLLENEARWLPPLSERLPLPVPAPLFVGEPGRGYPWRWSIVPWLPGRPLGETQDLDLVSCAHQLAGFLKALHQTAPTEAPVNPYRGTPLADRHDATLERIRLLGDLIDARETTRRWEQALAAPEHRAPRPWIHGDLHPFNVLGSEGRISAVIDFGDMTAGDPATDLAVGWMLFPAEIRLVFARSYGQAEEALWERAAGWALSLATAFLAGSADSPAMGEVGRATLGRLLRRPAG